MSQTSVRPLTFFCKDVCLHCSAPLTTASPLSCGEEEATGQQQGQAFHCLLLNACRAHLQVHASGGIAALVLVILLGPRLNRYTEKGVSVKMERQSVIMQVNVWRKGHSFALFRALDLFIVVVGPIMS